MDPPHSHGRAAAGDDDLNAIDRLIAKDAIRDLAARYMRGQDRLDRDLQMATFWPDATTDYGIFVGSGPEFVAFAQDLLKTQGLDGFLCGHSFGAHPEGAGLRGGVDGAVG